MFAIPLDFQAPSFIPGDYLAPELAPEDNIDWIEAGDYVRIERLVCRADADPQWGTIVRTRPEIEWALVEFEISRRMEWFHISELYLVLKASALEAEAASA